MRSRTIQPKPQLRAFFFHEPFEQNFWADILEEVYKKQVYLRFLPKKTTGTVCVDWGANVRLTAYYFSRYFERVLAVEPSQLHRESLTSMIKQNELKNVTVAPYAISNKNGKTKFYHNENQTMFMLESFGKTEDFEEVDTITVDSLFEKYNLDHIDLLKFDIEGAECEVINSEGFKKWAPKIQVIAGEWHEWAKCSKENFQHTLEGLGYKFRWRHDTKASVFEAERV